MTPLLLSKRAYNKAVDALTPDYQNKRKIADQALSHALFQQDNNVTHAQLNQLPKTANGVIAKLTVPQRQKVTKNILRLVEQINHVKDEYMSYLQCAENIKSNCCLVVDETDKDDVGYDAYQLFVEMETTLTNIIKLKTTNTLFIKGTNFDPVYDDEFCRYYTVDAKLSTPSHQIDLNKLPIVDSDVDGRSVDITEYTLSENDINIDNIHYWTWFDEHCENEDMRRTAIDTFEEFVNAIAFCNTDCYQADISLDPLVMNAFVQQLLIMPEEPPL